MKEVYSGIFTITEKGLFFMMKPPVNIYVITGTNGLVYDAGYGDRRSIRTFIREFEKIRSYCQSKNMPCNVTRILTSHSHGDHFSGLKGIRERFGFEILLTERMARRVTSEEYYRESYKFFTLSNEMIRPSVLFRLLSRFLHFIVIAYYKRIFGIQFVSSGFTAVPESGEIDVNGEKWMIFTSPGHCDDHISLYHQGRGLLFGGDNVLRSITTWLGPPNSDMKKYIKSLRFMLTLPNLAMILTSHGSPVMNPAERIREIISWREQRTEHVYEIISNAGERGVTMKEVLGRMYHRHEMAKFMLAEGWVDLTLRLLEEEGRILRRLGGKRVVYAPAGRS